MKRNFCILLLLVFINVKLLNAVILNEKGITTEKGFISWEQIMEMQNRLNSLENVKKDTKTYESRRYSTLEKANPIVSIGVLLLQILTRFPL